MTAIEQMQGDLGREAARLAAEGFHVFRCKPGDKRPKFGEEWKSTASNDPQAVTKLWLEDAINWNIGISCMPSGIFVLDVDGPKGEETLARLEEDNGRLPRTMEASTPGRGGGRHLYFKAPLGVELLPRIGDGLDIKHNGYVLAPPSVHPEGGTYRWTRFSAVAQPMPWLLRLAERQVHEDLPEPATPPVKVDGSWTTLGDWFDATFDCQQVMNYAATLMKGWKYAGQQGGNHAYTRPGKQLKEGISLVVYRFSRKAVRPCSAHKTNGRCENCMYTRAQMYSSALPDVPAQSYGPWRLFVHICFDDVWAEALEHVEAEGFRGEKWIPPARRPDHHKAPDQQTTRFVAVKASTLVAKKNSWVVPLLVPKKEITLVTGAPGGGKSLFIIDLVSRLTNGVPHPAGQGCFKEPINVLLMAGEDDICSRVLPRLDAAGADRDRVFVSGQLLDDSGELLPWDLRALREMREMVRDESISVVIFDVLKQFMKHRNDNDEMDVRGELNPLKEFCHSDDITAIGVRHTTKNPIAAQSAGGGSQAYLAACRSELLLTSDVAHDGSKLYVCTVNKSSYSVSGVRMEFKVSETERDVPLLDEDGVEELAHPERVEWMQGIQRTSNPDDVLAPVPERRNNQIMKEAVIRTLTGATEYKLPVNDFRRILEEHLDDLDYTGGRSKETFGNMERKLEEDGILTRDIVRLGRGNTKSDIILNPQWRRDPS